PRGSTSSSEPGSPRAWPALPSSRSRAAASAAAGPGIRPLAARAPANSEPLRTGGPPTRSSPSCSPSRGKQRAAPRSNRKPLPSGIGKGHAGGVVAGRGGRALERRAHAPDRQAPGQLDLRGKTAIRDEPRRIGELLLARPHDDGVALLELDIERR